MNEPTKLNSLVKRVLSSGREDQRLTALVNSKSALEAASEILSMNKILLSTRTNLVRSNPSCKNFAAAKPEVFKGDSEGYS